MKLPIFRAFAGLFFAAILLAPAAARAHCDTLEGPVVKAARQALEKKDATPVLRWVRAADEAEIRDAFAKTLKARALGPAAREIADRWFFETLVRIHRAGEGEPYDGLKPAGAGEPGIDEADAALASGEVEALAHGAGGAIAAGIARRHALAVKLKAHADESVEAGRAYVAAYVDYIHFVAAVHQLTAGGGAHAHAEPAPSGH